MDIVREYVDFNLTEEEVKMFKNLSLICGIMKEDMVEDTKEEERGYSFNTIYEYLSDIETKIDDFLTFMDED